MRTHIKFRHRPDLSDRLGDVGSTDDLSPMKSTRWIMLTMFPPKGGLLWSPPRGASPMHGEHHAQVLDHRKTVDRVAEADTRPLGASHS
jgi:hypothetical protein